MEQMQDVWQARETNGLPMLLTAHDRVSLSPLAVRFDVFVIARAQAAVCAA
jgi:hypothetical protein